MHRAARWVAWGVLLLLAMGLSGGGAARSSLRGPKERKMHFVWQACAFMWAAAGRRVTPSLAAGARAAA
eukprot:1342692-Prymnesium_polylepis.1